MTPELVWRGLASSKASERRSTIVSLTARDAGEEKLGEFLLMLPLFASEDPDPRVRIAAMKVMVETHEGGLCPLNKESCQKVERLLDDKNDDVRLHATRVLSHWGLAISQQIAAGSAANLFLESDKSFLQVSSMVCDMSKSVRAEACRGLARFCGGVSEEVLLQSLAKKMAVPSNNSNSSAGKAKGVTMLPPQSSGEAASEAIKPPPVGPTLLEKRAAGAFVQGLEDEFMEVRMEAAQSLAQHCLAFPKMVESGAAELLVDTLNDEMPAVRTTALESLFSLAQAGCLQLPPDLLVLVVAVADDTQPGMRHLAQRLLSLLPLASIEELRSVLRALLANLQRQPKDRPGIFDALYALGKRHTSLVQCIVNDLLHEARTLLCAPQGLEDPCYAALLVLVLSAVGEDPSLLSLIPPPTLRHASILRSCVPQFRSLGFEFRTAGVGTAVFSSSSSSLSSAVAGPGTPPRESASKHAQAEDAPDETAAAVQALVRKALEAGKGAAAAGHVGRSLLMLRECEQGLGRLSRGGTDEATTALVRFSQLFVRSLRALTRAQQLLLSEGGGALPVVGRGTILNLASELDRLTRRMRCCFTRLPRPLALVVAELSVVAALLPFASDEPPPHSGAHGPPVPSAGPEPPPPPPTGPAARAHLAAASASAELLSRDLRGLPGGAPLVASAAAVAAAAGREESGGEVAGKRRGWSPEEGRSAVAQYWPTDVDVLSLDLRETWAEVLSPACNKDEPVEFVPGLPLGISIAVAVHNPPPKGDLGRLWVMLELFGRPPLFHRLCSPAITTTSTTRLGSGLHVRPDSYLEIETTAIVHGLPAMNALAISITPVLADGGDTWNASRSPEERESNGTAKRKREEAEGRCHEAAEGAGSSCVTTNDNNRGGHAGSRGPAGGIVALSKRRDCYLALGKDRTAGKAGGAQTSGVK